MSLDNSTEPAQTATEPAQTATEPAQTATEPVEPATPVETAAEPAEMRSEQARAPSIGFQDRHPHAWQLFLAIVTALTTAVGTAFVTFMALSAETAELREQTTVLTTQASALQGQVNQMARQVDLTIALNRQEVLSALYSRLWPLVPGDSRLKQAFKDLRAGNENLGPFPDKALTAYESAARNLRDLCDEMLSRPGELDQSLRELCARAQVLIDRPGE